jgi:putative tricarboxylic transport membrane protein
MTNNKSDIIIAIFLLCFSGIMINDASNIRDLGFEGMKADAWPRVVLWLLVVMSSIMLGKSYIQFKTEGHKDNNTFHVNLSKFKNAIICFGMFLFFLSTLDYLGMLLGGIAFVFGLLTFLGGFSLNLIIRHFVISVLSIGFMWMVFTFGLRVMLPEGEILRVW